MSSMRLRSNMPTPTVLASGPSPLHPGWPPNEPTCLARIALYLSQLNWLEANKTPASNEHSKSSPSPEGGWESLSPAFCEGMLTYSSSSHSQSLCCSPAVSCSGVSPQGCSACPHQWQAQPNRGVSNGIMGIPHCLPGYCQSCWGPNLSLLTWVFMTPASTDFMGLGCPSSSRWNAILAGAVCTCCPSSISPENASFSQQPPVPGWEIQKEKGGLCLQRVYLWHFPNSILLIWATSCSISPWTEVFSWLVRTSFFH